MSMSEMTAAYRLIGRHIAELYLETTNRAVSAMRQSTGSRLTCRLRIRSCLPTPLGNCVRHGCLRQVPDCYAALGRSSMRGPIHSSSSASRSLGRVVPAALAALNILKRSKTTT